MAPNPTSRSVVQGPCFFLSYAHIPGLDSTRGPDPNRWVARLFIDLSEIVLNETKLKAAQAGFMDRGIQSGDRWPEQLAGALATCRVFIPLYSPRYFDSQECGKEWTAFAQRLEATPDRGNRLTAIIPALWAPLQDPEHLPKCAQEIQFDHEMFGPRYRQEGFYGLMKSRSMRTHYETAIKALARRIIKVAEQDLVPPGEPVDYMSLTSAFHDAAGEPPAKSSSPRMRLTVVAPDLSRLPDGRLTESYGQTPQEWNPFPKPGEHRPLASYAMELALRHGYLLEVGSFDNHVEHLTGAGGPDAPSVLVVDPWAARHAETREVLRRVCGQDRRPQPIVPWNLQDEQTAAAESELRALLREVIPERPGLPVVSHISSLGAFQRGLPRIFTSAAKSYLKSAPNYSPRGVPGTRPRLTKTEDSDGK
ncbi:hypothetical protein Aph01nite_21250 [Acrocarpospora phusangensis]|uniref:TIR domain-containing protein n=1 Tax=Acrocarpospora phusangensis TaxID=1070424 RepID=A0A919QBX3_9ACTN|nr:TIR-like protein FxsC [Acrocarpospora phusangensis]GIH23815.1 hypothetical protein Aph01nite_21250 [Acrocarpospora phusangensis]